MTERSADKIWKDLLLRSSLPLERLVAEKLEQHDFTVSGVYAYMRANEEGRETEFSVDIRAHSSLARRDRGVFSEKKAWGTLNILAECKYATPGVNWVFSPVSKKSYSPSRNCITCLDTICTERITSQSDLNNFSASMQSVTKGIVIHGSSADSNTITRGLSQLRYALPNVISQECYWQLHPFFMQNTRMSFICPMIVTTAQLYVLKTGLGHLAAYENAKQLDEVADLADAVVAYEEPGLHLYRYSAHLANQFVEFYPDVTPLLEQLDEALKENPAPSDTPIPLPLPYSSSLLKYPFTSAGSSILIVRYDALDDVLRTISSSALEAYKSARTIASVEVDGAKISRFVPIPSGEE